MPSEEKPQPLLPITAQSACRFAREPRRRKHRRISGVLPLVGILFFSSLPLGAQLILRGRLLQPGTVGMPAKIKIEITRYSSGEELRTLERHADLGDVEGFTTAFRAAGVAALRFSGGEGLNIIFNAACRTPTEKGIRILLATECRPVFPGDSQRTRGKFRFLVLALDLDKNFNGTGVAYEDAKVKFNRGDFDVESSVTVPINIENVQFVEGAVSGETLKTGKNPPSAAQGEALIQRALEDLDCLDYEEAVSLFDQALTLDPERLELRVKQAFALYRLNKIDQAMDALTRTLAVRPDDLPALNLLCFLEYKTDHPEAAEKTARKFMDGLDRLRKKRAPDDPKRDAIMRSLFPNAGVPAYILALRAKKIGNAAAVRTWLIEARELSYVPDDCWIQAIDVEIGRKNWTEAMRLCRSRGDIALEEKSSFWSWPPKTDAAGDPIGMNTAAKIPAEVLILAGYIYDHQGRFGDALAKLKAAVKRKPYSAAALKNLALAEINQGDAAAAAQVLRRLPAFAPEDALARDLSERIRDGKNPVSETHLELSRDFVDAVDVRYRYAFDRDPAEVAEKVNRYALNHIQKGNLSDAAGRLRAFVELCQDSPIVFYNLGQLYSSLGLKTEALANGIKAVELKNDYRDAHDLVANAWFKIGDFEAAAGSYENVIRMAPRDPMGYYNLGCAYNMMGRPSEAEKNWLTAVRLENESLAGGDAGAAKKSELDVALNVKVEPVSALACRGLGLLYAEQGKTDEALAFFLKAIELYPRVPPLYFEVGKLLRGSGDAAKAKEYFDKYLSLGGDKAQIEALGKK